MVVLIAKGLFWSIVWGVGTCMVFMLMVRFCLGFSSLIGII